jgi:hypothetical protein
VVLVVVRGDAPEGQRLALCLPSVGAGSLAGAAGAGSPVPPRGDRCSHLPSGRLFDKQGAVLTKWGAYGPALGQFGMLGTQDSRVSGPNFIAIDHRGDVYTTEGTVGRVQRFTAQGQPAISWGNMMDNLHLEV